MAVDARELPFCLVEVPEGWTRKFLQLVMILLLPVTISLLRLQYEYINNRVITICKILEILKGLSISLKFWLKIFGKLVSDILYSQVPIKRVGPNKRVGWIF